MYSNMEWKSKANEKEQTKNAALVTYIYYTNMINNVLNKSV